MGNVSLVQWRAGRFNVLGIRVLTVVGVIGLAIVVSILSTSVVRASTPIPGGTLGTSDWTLGGSPYIVQGGINVPAGVTLTVEPGVIVEFYSGAVYLEVNSGGTLLANGTVAQPITFTSVLTAPAPGAWYGLYQNGGFMQLSNCFVDYSGSSNTGVYLNASSASLTHCAIRNTLGIGLYLTGDGIAPQLDSVTVLSSSAQAIYQNTLNMSPAYHNLTLAGNNPDAVFIYSGNATYSNVLDGSPAALNGAPIILNAEHSVYNSVALTITPGSQLRFTPGATGLVINGGGSLIAQGTPTLPITFTSNAANPQPGDWYFLYFYSGSTGRLSHCDIAYTGYSLGYAMYMGTSDIHIAYCAIRNTLGIGLYLTGDGIAPQLDSVTVLSSSAQAIYQNTLNMSPAYHNITLAGNNPDAVFIYSGNATYSNVLDGSPAALNGAPIILNAEHSVYNTVALTIAPGSQLRFTPGGTGLVVNSGGSLIAQGTPTLPITFTSNAVRPQPGDWSVLYFYSGSTGRLSHCDIAYTGLSLGYAMYMGTSDIHIAHCAIRNTLGIGLYLTGDGIAPQLDSVSVLSSSAQAIYQTTLNMSPAYHNITLAGNNPDAVFIYGGNATYSNVLDGSPAALNGAPIILNSQHSIYNSVALTITPGSQLRFTPGGTGILINSGGSLIAQGAFLQPITFTSVLTPGTRQPGDWYYLYAYAGSVLRLAYCDISYSGGASLGALAINGDNAQIQQCHIHDNKGPGIASTNASFTVTRSSIYNNGLVSNPPYGVGILNNTPHVVIDARGNWWGDPSGPNNIVSSVQVTNPLGVGNGVSDWVLFSPWLTQPPPWALNAYVPVVIR